jgi:hypothetical protein
MNSELLMSKKAEVHFILMEIFFGWWPPLIEPRPEVPSAAIGP